MSATRLLPWLGLLLPAVAVAQGSIDQVWLNPGFYSYHFDRDKGLSDGNPGVGFEWPLDATWSLTAGTVRNSDRQQSNYVGAYYMPLEFHGVKFGVALGAFNGYPNYHDGGWFPALIPTASIESGHWGLNVMIIPTLKNRVDGAISFQLKYRFSAPEQ